MFDCFDDAGGVGDVAAVGFGAGVLEGGGEVGGGVGGFDEVEFFELVDELDLVVVDVLAVFFQTRDGDDFFAELQGVDDDAGAAVGDEEVASVEFGGELFAGGEVGVAKIFWLVVADADLSEDFVLNNSLFD